LVASARRRSEVDVRDNPNNVLSLIAVVHPGAFPFSGSLQFGFGMGVPTEARIGYAE